jgi:hypothetical protein
MNYAVLGSRAARSARRRGHGRQRRACGRCGPTRRRTAKDPVTLRRAIVVLMSAQGQSVPDIAIWESS